MKPTVHLRPLASELRLYRSGSYEKRSPYTILMNVQHLPGDKAVAISAMRIVGESSGVDDTGTVRLSSTDYAAIRDELKRHGINRVMIERHGEIRELSE